ncbi:MAG: lytic transglycosylase domain-containing protein [Dehalococcoidia bacterium]
MQGKTPGGAVGVVTRAIDRTGRTLKAAASWVDFAIAVALDAWWSRRAPEPARDTEILTAVPIEGSGSRYPSAYAAVAQPQRLAGRPRWFSLSGQLAVLFVACLSVAQVAQANGVGGHVSTIPQVIAAAPIRILAKAHTPAFVKSAPPAPAAGETQGTPLMAVVAVADSTTDDESAQAAPAAPAPPPASQASALPPAVVNTRLTEDEFRAYATSVGWAPETLDALVAVAHCESRFRTAAVGGGALGLMQIMPFWFDVAGVPLAMWADPASNLGVAKFIHDRQVNHGRDPWGPWACKPPASTTEGAAPVAPVIAPTVEPGAIPSPETGAPDAAETGTTDGLDPSEPAAEPTPGPA